MFSSLFLYIYKLISFSFSKETDKEENGKKEEERGKLKRLGKNPNFMRGGHFSLFQEKSKISLTAGEFSRKAFDCNILKNLSPHLEGKKKKRRKNCNIVPNNWHICI